MAAADEPNWTCEYSPIEITEKTLRALLAAPTNERTIMPKIQKGSSLLARATKA